jgi:hypothetical protein
MALNQPLACDLDDSGPAHRSRTRFASAVVLTALVRKARRIPIRRIEGIESLGSAGDEFDLLSWLDGSLLCLVLPIVERAMAQMRD